MIKTLPSGTRGFDADTTITKEMAHAAVSRQDPYKFVWRYVRRAMKHSYDVTKSEIEICHAAGLGVALVQHVSPAPWFPSKASGTNYGAVAASEALSVGFPAGATLACDLEGVTSAAPPSSVIDFLNAWYDEAARAGFLPLLYVGDSARLTAQQLYQNLRFKLYWSAYNLNADQYPAIRGVCIRQLVAHHVDWLPGLDSQTMDVDILQADRFGGLPVFYFHE